jgi:aryl-alcohol dehydrogenase-like predicted oxidoreductase
MELPHRVTLGRTGFPVSPICYGTWQLSPWFWGTGEEKDFIAAMRRAFDLGINFFDTADAYGNGLGETVLGKALREVPRDQVIVTTKVYHHFFPDMRRYGDLSREYIFEACENSLRRMGLDYVDLYLCHAWDPLATMAEIVDAMVTLVRQGKIRAYGTSNWTVEQMRYGNTVGNFAACQPPYDLLHKQGEDDLLPYCRATNTGTMVYSPLFRGLLGGRYKGTETFDDARAKVPEFQGERFKTIAERVSQLGPIAEGYGLSIVQLVLAATLMHPSIDCAIVGVKRTEQIEESAGAMGKKISREDWYKIRGLLSV